jgi:hypothetical protein
MNLFVARNRSVEMSSAKVVNKIREIVANSSGAILGFTLLHCNQFDTSDKFQLRIWHGCRNESFNQTIAVPTTGGIHKGYDPGSRYQHVANTFRKDKLQTANYDNQSG